MRAYLSGARISTTRTGFLVAGALASVAAAASFPPTLLAQQAQMRGEVSLRIGVMDGDANYTFGDIRGLICDAGGRIVVVDQQAQQVSLFADDGKFLYSFGRGGAGPGDLDLPCCPSMDTAGRLWLMGQTRFDAFELGDSSATHRDRIDHGGRARGRSLMFDDGGGPIPVYPRLSCSGWKRDSPDPAARTTG